MVLQCNLTLKHNDVREISLYETDCLSNLDDSEIRDIKEYDTFSLEVISDNSKDCFFELPEMEDYAITSNLDINDKYEFNQNYTIFATSWDNSKSEDKDLQTVPLTPGYYTIKIHLEGNKLLFGYWRIIPKDLSIPEWELIKRDVEKRIKGLALDFSEQRRSKGRQLGDGKKHLFLDNDIEFLVTHESQIRYAVETLRNEAKYRINKKYVWRPAGSKGEIDQQTLRKVGERPDKQGFLYMPHRYLEYNVAANRWLKLCLSKLANYCSLQMQYIKNLKSETISQYNQEKTYLNLKTGSEQYHERKIFKDNISKLQEEQRIIRRMYQYFKIVLEDSFLKGLSLPNNVALPKTLMLNTSYNLLYRVYTILFQQKKQYVLDDYYQHYWKKTAQLYEIWTYVKTIDALIDLGFQPTDGWIYNDKDKTKLPFLNDGTRIKFSGESVMLYLVYNEALPYFEEQVSLEQPLKTMSSRNKPDIRIDVYNLSSVYLGSIMLDAKYKELDKLLSSVKNRKDRIRDQFRAYVNDPISPFHMNNRILRDTKPVEALIVLYPSNNKSVDDEDSFSMQHIYFTQMKPGVAQDSFEKRLKDHLVKIKEREDFLKFGN